LQCLYTAQMSTTIKAGLMEPYSLFVSSGIAVPTIVLSAYTYTRIRRSPAYRNSQYLRVYTAKGVNDTMLFAFSLVVHKLPLQSFMYYFYKGNGDVFLVNFGIVCH
ncbi:hypothetical protein PMAYCL1PPCAC_09725, partial [Pristionchus mayeri]